MNDFETIYVPYRNTIDNYKNTLGILLKAGEKAVVEKQEIQREYFLDKSDKLNFFTIVSQKYRWEKFHSEFIKALLMSSSWDDKDTTFLSEFLNFIGVQKDFTINKIQIETEYEIKTDISGYTPKKGYIDILIHDGSSAVIIENKMDYATDQKDQIPRYYDFFKNSEKVIKIIYLAPSPSKKLPTLNSYSKSFVSIAKEIEEKHLLQQLNCVDEKGKPTFIQFLEKCEKRANTETKRVLFEQYANLLKYIGGNQMIMENVNEELLAKLMETDQSRKAADDCANLWNGRFDVMNNIFEKMAYERGYEDWHKSNINCYKYIPQTNDKIYWYYTFENNVFEIGIGEEKGTSKKVYSEYVQKFKDAKNSKGWKKTDNELTVQYQYYYIEVKDINCSLEEAKKMFSEVFDIIETIK